MIAPQVKRENRKLAEGNLIITVILDAVPTGQTKVTAPSRTGGHHADIDRTAGTTQGPNQAPEIIYELSSRISLARDQGRAQDEALLLKEYESVAKHHSSKYLSVYDLGPEQEALAVPTILTMALLSMQKIWRDRDTDPGREA